MREPRATTGRANRRLSRALLPFTPRVAGREEGNEEEEGFPPLGEDLPEGEGEGTAPGDTGSPEELCMVS